ncbi:O-methyltransferase [Paraliobacillus sediminis]|uniref:O-methyltransferase n=1 Tax=Paraliobacillus sediminis TaxID=1885916 RepID=UPI000E3DCC85|nr:O-methyltransferase [Paraliobacillus sediminis]
MDYDTEQYLSSLLEPKTDWVKKLEIYASDNHVPIMEPMGIAFLKQIIRMKKPSKILEIGTAIGYSALQMASAYPSTTIVTIERDLPRYQEAIGNISNYSDTRTIDLVYGDALEISGEIEEKGKFDLLFIDAAKGQYQRFFELYAPFLNQDGIIISDNVLFKGMVASESSQNKRQQRIATKIRSYNEWLVNMPTYHTTIVPIGDGIAITTKKQQDIKGDS